MESYEEKVGRALKLIESSSKILIVPSSPVDADALGSSLALKGILEKMGKTATINYSFEHVGHFKFLPGFAAVVIKDIYETDFAAFDLTIFLDSGHLSQFYDQSIHPGKLVLPENIKTLNIDHHLTNEGFAHLTLHRLDVSSTAEMIHDLFRGRVEFDVEMAINLLAGIANDTGNFRYASASPKTLRTTADLMERGASLPQTALNLYYTSTAMVVRFAGYLSQKIKINESRRYGFLTAGAKEWQEFGLDYEQFRESFHRALEDNLKLIAEVDFVFAVGEKEPGYVGVSFRNRRSGELDLTVVAKSLGGGGHADSCGARIFDRSVEEVLALVEKSIAENYARMKIG